jgi:hypothetical protein
MEGIEGEEGEAIKGTGGGDFFRIVVTLAVQHFWLTTSCIFPSLTLSL